MNWFFSKVFFVKVYPLYLTNICNFEKTDIYNAWNTVLAHNSHICVTPKNVSLFSRNSPLPKIVTLLSGQKGCDYFGKCDYFGWNAWNWLLFFWLNGINVFQLDILTLDWAWNEQDWKKKCKCWILKTFSKIDWEYSATLVVEFHALL